MCFLNQSSDLEILLHYKLLGISQICFSYWCQSNSFVAREHTLYEFTFFQFIQVCLMTQNRIVFKTFMGSLKRTFVVIWKHPWSQCFQVPLIFSFAYTLLKLSSVVLKLPLFLFILSFFLSVFRNADLVMIRCGQVLLGKARSHLSLWEPSFLCGNMSCSEVYFVRY